MATAATLTRVWSNTDVDVSQNDMLEAVLSFTPSSTYPTGGDPCDLALELDEFAHLDFVDATPVAGAALTTSAEWHFDPTAKKLMAFWDKGSKGTLPEVDNGTDLLAVCPVVKIHVVGRR
jgi:hypothetical protein